MKKGKYVYKEYGSDNRDIIVLLHGGGLSWWNYREEAEFLQDKYHIIIPVLDGHAGSDRSFTTIEQNADELISLIDEEFGGKVLLIGGLSLGAQILLEMLSQRRDICKHAIVESASVIPSKITHMLIGPAFGSTYGLVKHEGFAKKQFRSLHMKQELFGDYYRDTCLISKSDMISFLRANTSYSLKSSIGESDAEVHVLVGEKENRKMKYSAKRIIDAIPGSVFHGLKGLYHGEFSINYAEGYSKLIMRITNRDLYKV